MSNELRNNLREAYNRTAQERERCAKQPWKLAERAQFLALLQAEGKRSLLEIGAGTGQDGKFFQDHGLEVTCIDLAPEMVTLCRQKGLTAYVMDVADLPFARASFDAVYALNSLLHLPKHELPAVLHAIDTSLRPTGLCYVGVYGGRDWQGIWHGDSYDPQRFFSFYSDDHLQQALAQVFDVCAFKRIRVDEGSDLHFQSCILRKKASHSIKPS